MIAIIRRLLARYSRLNWALADQGMVSGANFLTGIMLARYLGLEEFGRYTLAWMAVLFVNSIQSAVIISPMMSLGSKQASEDRPSYYGAVAAQQIAFGGAAFILVWIGANTAALLFPAWRIDGLALPLACAALAFQLQEFMRRYFFTLGRGGAAFASDAMRYLGQIAVLIWLFTAMPMDSSRTLWVIAAMASMASLATLPMLGQFAWQADRFLAIASHNWQFSKWLVGSALMQWTSGQLFFIAAGALLGASAVGALRAAQNLMGLCNILFQALENVVPVSASRHFHSGGNEALLNYLRRVTLLGELATAAIVATVSVAPEFWLGLVFGGQYGGYGYLLQWYAVRHMLFFLTLSLRAGLRATEHTNAIFWSSVARTVFSLLTVYPLIYFMGLTGVMMGLVSSALIGLGVLVFQFRKLTDLSRVR